MPWDEDSLTPDWQDLYHEIGTLVVAGGQLEGTVRSLLLNLIGGPNWRRSGLVVEGYTAGQMGERCERLTRIVLAGSLQADVLEWLREVVIIQRFRNSIVHADWASKVLLEGGLEVGPAAMTRKIAGAQGLQTKVSPHTAQDIRTVAGRCAQATTDGTALIVELQEFAELERQQQRDLAPWARA